MNLYNIVYTINDGSGRGIRELIYAKSITKALQLSKFDKTFHIELVCKRQQIVNSETEQLVSRKEFPDRDLIE